MAQSRSFNPRTGRSVAAMEPTDNCGVDWALRAATRSLDSMARQHPDHRASWLRSIASAIEAHANELVELADTETALGLDRLHGELFRTAEALRFYGAAASEGSWLGATIDRGNGAKPDLRRINQPLGPVAVFGASNFPFGFGVVGHDTASALAVGCPVVVKAHPAHPRLSTALAEIALAALTREGAPEGVFNLVSGFTAGEQLVSHTLTAAVAFTGSQRGGMALWQLANSRDQVIPVFAEMGTVNTVVITPSAAVSRGSEIAEGFVESFTGGMGQVCTKPGILLVPQQSDIPTLLIEAFHRCVSSGWLLTEDIASHFADGIKAFIDRGAEVLASTDPPKSGFGAGPALLRVPVEAMVSQSRFFEECFGPVALVCEYRDQTELDAVLRRLPGGLAAAVHSHGDEDESMIRLVDQLSRIAGRVVVNGWTTGVAPGWSQHHGGPWPATSNPKSTSVGSAALSRFVRPTTYQNVPEAALPPALQMSNPWQLPRRVDGLMS
ncbi:aldehyde dehydrogenase family protein [Rhodococcus sp. NPDC060176]|uniref:aldehyde dehydrogenase family protein n=1 Tax=Rhodococcus sp. NPDC060176 TaxID=3347062 RepID=UPI00365B3F75